MGRHTPEVYGTVRTVRLPPAVSGDVTKISLHLYWRRLSFQQRWCCR